MLFDSAFDNPDIAPDFDPDDLEGCVPSYTCEGEQVGDAWHVTVRGLPGGAEVHVQGKTWRKAKRHTIDAVQKALGPDSGVYGLQFVPADPEAAEAVDAYYEARQALCFAEQKLRDTAREAARTLTAQGWSNRDTGSVLMMSHQRISQLAPRDARQE
ncbi:hypothetical protein [Yinghuangia soli]|uniref:Uncharacterized protein n=1 Tax=Yinghuangia soli TaxID=2908204 RepID=A0AA41Q758_9ACTN|nr:hypothetical protein [Yinghuangia soli]MCF2532748.1 hypothetical protein [Yinghuangia soli]